MPNVGKAADVGWIYHVPNKTRNAGPVGVPPPSQIPGLSSNISEPPPVENFRGVIKDTDSKYVRLAKQGGRPDLLVFRDPRTPPEKAKGYPRVNWFYLEDNAIEDAANDTHSNEPYQFALPDYMVHHEYAGSTGQKETDPEYSPKRAPFHFDNKSAFERDGPSLTDKTVALPEPSAPGRSMRNAKQKKQNIKFSGNQKPAKEEASGQKDSRYLSVPKLNSEEERPVMSKILSYGYVKDWEEKRREWQEAQTKARSEAAADKEEKVDKFAKKSEKPEASKLSNKSKNNATSGDANIATEHSGQSSEAKEPFKLSKFKNIPARTNTNRTSQT